MDLVRVCNALGNETRFQIVKSLKDRSIGTCCGKIEYFENGVSVADVVLATGLAQSTVSQHLRLLFSEGLLENYFSVQEVLLLPKSPLDPSDYY